MNKSANKKEKSWFLTVVVGDNPAYRRGPFATKAEAIKARTELAQQFREEDSWGTRPFRILLF
jgi:hypothetical protein